MVRAKQKLTEDQKLVRRAEQKAKKINANDLEDVGPLFAHEATPVTVKDMYWQIRKSYADSPRGNEAAYLYGIDFKINLFIIRNIAKRHMTAEDFFIADNKRWVGDVILFWRKLLTGAERYVLSWKRISNGWRPIYFEKNQFRDEHMMYVENVSMVEDVIWPPDGWKAPLTAEEFDELTSIADPMESGFEHRIEELIWGSMR